MALYEECEQLGAADLPAELFNQVTRRLPNTDVVAWSTIRELRRYFLRTDYNTTCRFFKFFTQDVLPSLLHHMERRVINNTLYAIEAHPERYNSYRVTECREMTTEAWFENFVGFTTLYSGVCAACGTRYEPWSRLELFGNEAVRTFRYARNHHMYEVPTSTQSDFWSTVSYQNAAGIVIPLGVCCIGRCSSCNRTVMDLDPDEVEALTRNDNGLCPDCQHEAERQDMEEEDEEDDYDDDDEPKYSDDVKAVGLCKCTRPTRNELALYARNIKGTVPWG